MGGRVMELMNASLLVCLALIVVESKADVEIPALVLEMRNVNFSCFLVFDNITENDFPKNVEKVVIDEIESEDDWDNPCAGSSLTENVTPLWTKDEFLELVILERIYEISIAYQIWLDEVQTEAFRLLTELKLRRHVEFLHDEFCLIFQRAFLRASPNATSLKDFSRNVADAYLAYKTSKTDCVPKMQTVQEDTVRNILRLLNESKEGNIERELRSDDLFFDIEDNVDKLLKQVPTNCANQRTINYTRPNLYDVHICHNNFDECEIESLNRELKNCVASVNDKAGKIRSSFPIPEMENGNQTWILITAFVLLLLFGILVRFLLVKLSDKEMAEHYS